MFALQPEFAYQTPSNHMLTSVSSGALHKPAVPSEEVDSMPAAPAREGQLGGPHLAGLRTSQRSLATGALRLGMQQPVGGSPISSDGGCSGCGGQAAAGLQQTVLTAAPEACVPWSPLTVAAQLHAQVRARVRAQGRANAGGPAA